MSRWPERTVEERFWSHVDFDGPVPEYAPHLGNCWLWRSATHKGYGRFTISVKRARDAHRVAFALWYGLWPDGDIDHLCRVTACVNPFHLEAVTHRTNILRGFNWPAEQARKTECAHGHPFNAANTHLRPDGSRLCRTCNRERAARNYARSR